MPSQPLAGGLHEEITLPHEQEWELYHNSFSLCSKKLRVCLDELGIAHASHPIDLIETGAYENVGRRYLAVNPAGLVPVLVHRGHPIYESHEEIVYAARHAGERGRALLPEDAKTRARVERWSDCASLVGDPTRGVEKRAGHCIPGLTLPLFAAMNRHVPWRRFARGLVSHPDKRRPLFLAALKAVGPRGLPRLRPAMALLVRSREAMGRHLDALGAHLAASGGPWIAGERFTLADVSWVVILDRLVEADWDAWFWGDGRRPQIAAYFERLSKRPSYERAIASQRSPNLIAGARDLRATRRAHPTLYGDVF